MTVQDFKNENFSQAEEEAAAEVGDALENLVQVFGIAESTAYLTKVSDFLDRLTLETLEGQEAHS